MFVLSLLKGSSADQLTRKVQLLKSSIKTWKRQVGNNPVDALNELTWIRDYSR